MQLSKSISVFRDGMMCNGLSLSHGNVLKASLPLKKKKNLTISEGHASGEWNHVYEKTDLSKK